MARHNPIFGNDQAVRQGQSYEYGRPASAPGSQFTSDFGSQYGQTQTQQAPGAYGQGQYGQAAPAQYGQSQYGQAAPSAESLDAMYARPAASGHDTGRMTMRDALNAITATLGIIIVVGAGVGLLPSVLGMVAGDQGFSMGVMAATVAMIIGAIGGLISGLVLSFKKAPSAILTLVYAVFEGMLLGGISGLFEQIYPGIALQAVLATFAVAGTVLVMFRMGVLRTSARLTKIFMVSMVAYLIFSVVNIGIMFFTGANLRYDNPWLGLIIGGLAVVMAAYSLVMDFEDVQRAVNGGAPRTYAWRVAFGVAATLVWMYMEILRIISILRNN